MDTTAETREREARELVSLTDIIVAYAMGFDHERDVTFDHVAARLDAYRTAILAAAVERVEGLRMKEPARRMVGHVDASYNAGIDAASAAIRGEGR